MSYQQTAAALEDILAHATAGRLTTDRATCRWPLVAEAWSRCDKSPYRRAVLIS